MDFLRRSSQKSTLLYKDILIIYKYTSTEALNFTKDFVEYFINKEHPGSIYLEELKSFKSIIETNDKKESKNKTEIILFDQKEHCFNIDLVIVLGGDGTVLWSSSLFMNVNKPPFLTFNLGTLGYLSYFKCFKYKEVFEELFENKDKIISYEKRSTLDVSFVSDNKDEEDPLKDLKLNCLNDVVFEKGNGNHLIKTSIYLNNEYFTTIKADGVLASTSTGSTAYSLSAGGTILHYDVDTLILNSMCPHTLSFRPIAFSKDVSLKFMLDTDSKEACVSNDGINTYKRKPGQGIEVKISDYYINIIILDNIIDSPLKNWKDKLVNQLGWNTGFKNN